MIHQPSVALGLPDLGVSEVRDVEILETSVLAVSAVLARMWGSKYADGGRHDRIEARDRTVVSRTDKVLWLEKPGNRSNICPFGSG